MLKRKYTRLLGPTFFISAGPALACQVGDTRSSASLMFLLVFFVPAVLALGDSIQFLSKGHKNEAKKSFRKGFALLVIVGAFFAVYDHFDSLTVTEHDRKFHPEKFDERFQWQGE